MTATATDLYDALHYYGVSYEGEQGPYVPTEAEMTLAELVKQHGGRIVRVRFIGGDYIPGRGKCYDLSYVHGVTSDGRRVRLIHTPHIALEPRKSLKGELIVWAKEEGVFAKGCGLLDDANFSILG